MSTDLRIADTHQRHIFETNGARAGGAARVGGIDSKSIAGMA